MNKFIKSFIFGMGVAAMALTSCTGDFDEMNTDPNNPTPGSVEPKFQLVLIQSRGIPYAQNWQSIEEEMISTFTEYCANDGLSASDYNIDSRYVDGLWSISYNVLTNANSLIKSNLDKPKFNNTVQIARIWKAFVMLRLTDCLGDIPYTEAAANIDQPKYDSQKDIYYTIFDELTDAVAKLDNSANNNIGAYDLVYGGDANLWKKFANSLRLRMAVRISDVDPAKAKAEAAAAVAAGVMTSSAESGMLTQGDATATQNPIYYHKNSGVIYMSTAYKRLVTDLGGQKWPTAADQALNPNITTAIVNAKGAPAKVDPRAPIHFEPAGQVTTTQDPAMVGVWDGTDPGHVASGVGAAMDNGQFVNNYAKIGPWYYGDMYRKVPLIKFSEVCFLKAIAIELGLISGDAKGAYEAGVTASMEELGVPAGIIAEYLADVTPNYYGTTANYDHRAGNCNTALDKILTQKYLDQFQEGCFETWADHRQFHKPTLMPFANVYSGFQRSAADVANNTPEAYIKRLYYPSSEFTVNADNVKAAAAKYNDNSTQANVWWDVKK
ncbi:MAG: SusD/RagB family nutrient-binding outer membrane lipoprotein [Bacteroidales bacterium]|nr:SusD/RagB family nutrient-binding outer membrane lipoprotein [Bacteroidales bacterium]